MYRNCSLNSDTIYVAIVIYNKNNIRSKLISLCKYIFSQEGSDICFNNPTNLTICMYIMYILLVKYFGAIKSRNRPTQILLITCYGYRTNPLIGQAEMYNVYLHFIVFWRRNYIELCRYILLHTSQLI